MEDLKKYSFRDYEERYHLLFQKEKRKLKKIFPKSEIEHVGSSSVKGLGGKGIIDIVISIPQHEIQKVIKKLQENGYEYKPNAGDKERRFLQKLIKYAGKERRIHIHLTDHNSKTWKSMIAMREYFKKHKKIADKYLRLKKEAVKYAKGDGKKYRLFKKPFLDQIERIALKARIK